MATTSATGSLSGLGLSGLASGLDTSGIITKLMSIEAQPQAQLKTQLSSLTAHTAALQSLNTQLAAIATAATTASTTGSLAAFGATSDTASVTAAAGGTAAPGSVSFTVGRLAQAQVSVSDAMTTWADTSSTTPSITIQLGSGATATTKTVTAATGSLDDVVDAINKGATGVTATKVAAGTDASGNPQYRIQLRSTATGAAGAFTVYEGADTTGTPLPVTNVATAQDASITLYAGTAAEQVVTSASNTFTSLATGLDVTVSATTTTPVTVTVTPDSSKAAGSAANLTGTLIALFSTVSTRSTVTPGATAGSAGTPGVFTGDLLVRNLNDAVLSAVTDPVGGLSPSTIGITLTKTGTITFDQTAFTAAMQKDPAGTTSMFQTIAGRIATAATAASDSISGTLTTAIRSEQSQETDLSDQISSWDTRLADIQARYQTQFNNLETAMQSLQSQSTWLNSQISGLTTNYQQSK
jgi:flagellar hook-associated protein 2